jgi:hypothetical protein
MVMKDDTLNKVWLALMLGVLVATSPNWLLSGKHQQSTYDAPWIYPADRPAQAQ